MARISHDHIILMNYLLSETLSNIKLGHTTNKAFSNIRIIRNLEI